MPSNVPHGAAIERAMSAAMEIISALPDDEDHAFLLGSLDGETEIFEVLDRDVEGSIADNKLAEAARERAKRVEERARKSREIARGSSRRCSEPAEAPVYTASITYPRKPLVTNADALPGTFIRHAPRHGGDRQSPARWRDIPGAELKNPEPQLTIRVS